MANTASFTLDARITEGTVQICDRTFPKDDTTITQYLDDQVTVAAGATDLAISLASVGGTAKNILVTFSAGATVKLQSNTNTGIVIGADGGAFSFVNGSITAMYVTNAGTSAITVKRVAAS